MSDVRISPVGDRALMAEFGSVIDPQINDQVQALAQKIRQTGLDGVKELVPTFCSLMIYYDPLRLNYGELAQKVRELSENLSTGAKSKKRILQIPCCYGSHFGPDLSDLEKHSGLTRDEIIFLHSSACYRVYMLGFLPGFVYLGGLDKSLEMPRLPVPRVKIPTGAVGIGGSQTGVYPMESPGGWRLIGGTPVDFYDPDREQPVLCQAGDYIQFVPINSSDYYDIRQLQLRGRYQVTVLEEDRKAGG